VSESKDLTAQPVARVATDGRASAALLVPSERLRSRLRWFSLFCLAALLLLLTAEIAYLQPSDNASLVIATSGLGLVLLVSLWSLAGDRRRGLAVAAALMLSAGGILAGSQLTAGNDAAVAMPFIGAVILVAALEGRQLIFGLVLCWLAGAFGTAVAFTTPALSSLPHVVSPMMEGVITGLMTAPGYAILGLVAERRRAAVARALEAADAAHHAEEAQRHTAETLRVLSESSPLATLAFDKDGKIHAWNAAAERLVGRSAAETLGRSIVELVPEGARAGVRRRLAALERGQVAGLRNGKLVRKDGTEAEVEIHEAIEFYADGRPAGVVVQFLDLAERQEMQARLMEAQRLEAVATLAGGVAHDFNNSLTAIAGFASMIASGASPDPAEDAQTILTAAEHAAKLTRQLLAFSRRVPLQPEVIDAGQFLAGVESLVGSLVGEAIAVHLDTAEEPCRVRVDPSGLEEAILNLAANSRDAMPDGGEITLGCRPCPNCPNGDTAEAQDHVAIFVADTGTGFAPECMHRLFEPFFTTKPPGRGTGLGLPMIHGFAAQSGGHVLVTSPPGRGATVEMHFPVSTEEVAGPHAVPDLVGGSETILFVEDDPAVASFGLACLRSLGYDVTPAMDGSEAVALAAARDKPFDLLLTDVIIPGMSGVELASLVHRQNPSTAILYVSGYSEDLVSEKTGPGALLMAKPYSQEQLALRVREALEARSA
jgi:PAS domain S-box-containing protein